MLLVGICIGVTGVYVYWFYNLSSMVATDHNNLSAVVQYLNNQIQASQPVKK